MPQLLINDLGQNGQIDLYFCVSNTTIQYRVAGANPAEQGDSITALGNAMTNSQEATVEILNDVIDPWPNGYSNDVVAAQLFNDTDALYVTGDLLYTAPEQAVLWDVLEDVGLALLEVFV